MTLIVEPSAVKFLDKFFTTQSKLFTSRFKFKCLSCHSTNLASSYD